MTILRNDVLIRPKLPKEISNNGIVIPENARCRNSCGEIVLVGPKSYLKPGFYMFHVEHTGVPIELEGEVLYLVQERDVLAYTEN